MKKKKRNQKKEKREKQVRKINPVKELISKAIIAGKYGFYLEASWIISEVVEIRVKEILKITDQDPVRRGMNLEQCLKRVKYLLVNKQVPLVEKHFTILFLDELRNWKNNRNTILKDLLTIHVSKQRIEKLAEDGIILMKELNDSWKPFKKEHAAVVAAGIEPSPEISGNDESTNG